MALIKPQQRKIRRTRAQWQSIMSDFEQSDLGGEAYCQRHGLAYSSFAKWRSLLKQEVSPDDEPVSFIQLPNTLTSLSDNATGWDIELDLGAGVIIRLKSR